MGSRSQQLLTYARRAIKSPSRLPLLAIDPKRWRVLVRRLWSGSPRVPDWGPSAQGLSQRRFESHESYRRIQASKLAIVDLDEYDTRFYGALRERIRGETWGSVMCLGARLGSEVRAFVDEGAFAVGIDLNPGKANRYVLTGDFHSLQFADDSVDAVFTNSLDHALDLKKVCLEIARVLKADGTLVVEAVAGSEEFPDGFGTWEATAWERVDDLINAITEQGFTLISQKTFEDPWPGRHLRFCITREK